MSEQTRCTTQRGEHRCDLKIGHKGPCDTVAKEYAIAFDKPCSACGKRIGDHVVEGKGLVCP